MLFHLKSSPMSLTLFDLRMATLLASDFIFLTKG